MRRDEARPLRRLGSRARVVCVGFGTRRVRRRWAARRREPSAPARRSGRSVFGRSGRPLRRLADEGDTDGSSAAGWPIRAAAPRCSPREGDVGLSAIPTAVTTASAVRPIAAVRRDRSQVDLGRVTVARRGGSADAGGRLERAARSPSPAVGEIEPDGRPGAASDAGPGQLPKQSASPASGSGAEGPPVAVVAIRSAIGPLAESFEPAVGIWARTWPDRVVAATSSWWQKTRSPCARTCALATELWAPTSSGAVMHDGRVGVGGGGSLTLLNPLSGRREQESCALARRGALRECSSPAAPIRRRATRQTRGMAGETRGAHPEKRRRRGRPLRKGRNAASRGSVRFCCASP